MKKNKMIILLIIVIVSVFLIFFIISVSKFLLKFDELGKVEIENSIYSLTSSKIRLKNVRTSESELITLKKATVINFWATWCKPCIEEQASLEKMSLKFPKVNFILMSYDSINNQKKIIKSLNWHLPAYLLEDTSIFKQPLALPLTIFLQDSTVVQQFYGAQDWEDTSVTNLLNTLCDKNFLP